jgi:hypothetical protein
VPRRQSAAERTAAKSAAAFARAAEANAKAVAKRELAARTKAAKDLKALEKRIAGIRKLGGIPTGAQTYLRRKLRGRAAGKSVQETRGHKPGQEYKARKAYRIKRYGFNAPVGSMAHYRYFYSQIDFDRDAYERLINWAKTRPVARLEALKRVVEFQNMQLAGAPRLSLADYETFWRSPLFADMPTEGIYYHSVG